MPASLLLDLLVAVLLAVTIGYAVTLNQRLKGLKKHKDELEALAASFAQATTRAEESIGRLKSSVSELHAASERANALRDDLAFLVERGGAIADRLEDSIRTSRDMGLEAARPTLKPKPAKASAAAPAKRPEPEKVETDPARELLKALRSAR